MILVAVTLIGAALITGYLLGDHLGYDNGKIIGAALEYQRGWEDGYDAGARAERIGLKRPRLTVHRGGGGR